MQFTVNEECIGCGLCACTCPDVFKITDAGVAKACDGPVDASMEANAKEAMQGCPVGAIEMK